MHNDQTQAPLKADPQIVLFVCTGNYYRSRYAELYFNAHVAPESGWRAESRGFAPEPSNVGPISPTVLTRLAAKGLTAPADVGLPTQLAEADLQRATYIVALDADEHPPYVERLFPDWRGQFRYWRIADLGFMTVDDALSGIERAVDLLITELNIDCGESLPQQHKEEP